MASESTKSKPPKSIEEELHDLLPGIVSSRGWWRLSIVVGVTVAIPWIVFILYTMDGRWSQLRPDAMPVLLLVTIASFFLPWSIVQVVGWVVEGFTQKSN